jgi:hypothetical protein
MKTYLLVLSFFLLLSQAAYADEFIHMSNGMTCLRDKSGYTYGCSGGSSTGDSGFNETDTGRRYNRINDNQVIDTETGQPINVPRRDRNDGSDNDK